MCVLAIAITAWSPSPALGSSASSGKKAQSGGHGAAPAGKEKVQPNDPTEVMMPPVIVPVTRDATLVGYLYVGVVLKGEDEAKAQAIGKAMPLFQDAMLRAMNSAPVPVDQAETEATKGLILTRLEDALRHVQGAPPIKSVQIKDILSASF